MGKKNKKVKKLKEKKSKVKINLSSGKLKKAKPKKEVKKKEKVGFFKRISNFFRELKGELKKIAWPTKGKVFSATLVVIIAIVIMALFVVFVDLIVRSLLKMLIKTL